MANSPRPKELENTLLVVNAVDRGIDKEIVRPQALELLEIASDERAAMLRFKRRDVLLPSDKIGALILVCIHERPRLRSKVGSASARVRSNGEVEGLRIGAGQAPRAHTVPKRPRRQTDYASRPPPTIVRRHRHST